MSEGKRLYDLGGPAWAREEGEEPWDWGAVCDGAHRLALALLSDALADPLRARRLCAQFCAAVVASLPYASWVLTAANVRAWAENEEARRTVEKGGPR